MKQLKLLKNVKSLTEKYQIGLEKSMRGSDFMFCCVHLLYYECHKINFKKGRSNKDSSNWVKNKKVTINLINKKIINIFNAL